MGDQMNLGYLVNKAARRLKGELDQGLSVVGLTSAQFSVLKDLDIQERLNSQPKEHTLAAIADRIDSDRPTVSGILSRLETNGWIYRLPHPNDRRSQVVKLAEKGKEQMSRLNQISDQVLDQAIQGFEPEEIAVFKEYLNRLISNMERKEG